MMTIEGDTWLGQVSPTTGVEKEKEAQNAAAASGITIKVVVAKMQTGCL